ncbi:uncharacterized protein LOC119099616 [Pollicipes pollicipes]|uniref:uncharacterized protein LOC119099616 n=1 Tax=Pollicipes pollicipes TaxID=41117 RepID=UPI0018853029|nr:uncharacterized protein LOC119099616 [Pollicipes pollicipes]
MGDEGNVMRLLLEMMTYLEDKPDPAESCEPGVLDGPAADAAAPYAADDYEPPRRWQAAARSRPRDERRRVLRLATEKLAAIEENERCLRWEKDLRQATLLQNMAARLETEARAERAARVARSRGARSYSRTLGRSLGGAHDTCGQRRRRRRDEGRLLEADVQEMFSDIYHPPAPALIGRDGGESPTKRPRLGWENADPNAAPQEQVRFGDEPPLGCAAAAGFADFQHVFHHLVPSLES